MKRARFQKIVDKHKDCIYSHALYFLGNRPDAEDVTQEVLIRAWQNLDAIGRRTTKAWLMRVTHNLCIDYARHRKASGNVMRTEDISLLETKTATSLTESDPELMAENSDLKRQLLDALQRLPEHLRSVIMLREIHDMKYEQISHALSIPLNSVKVYIHRGRRELRTALRQLLAEEIG